MAVRIDGSYQDSIRVAIDLRGLAKARKLDAGTDPRDIVSSWLASHPSTSTYVEDESVVGESEMLGSSFVQGYQFSDRELANDFRKSFDGHLLPPRLWYAYMARTTEAALSCP